MKMRLCLPPQLFLVLVCACAQTPPEAQTLTPAAETAPAWHYTPDRDYGQVRADLAQQRAEWARQFREAPDSLQREAALDSAAALLTRELVSGIFPHWMGTPWDFEGHTDVPGQGEVACGYLVSTTLRHAGFNLNRYKLAQQSAFSACKTLNMGQQPERLAAVNPAQVADDFLASQKDGLYVVGQDYHVGFLFKSEGRLLFIHSSYLPPAAVTAEIAHTSAAFGATRSHWITPVTHNRPLIKAWLSGATILITP